MKKFYAFAAAAMMSVAAFAQNGAPLYCCGSGSIGWDPAAPKEFTYANGEYTLTVVEEGESGPMQAFKISTAFGDWETFNAASIGCPNYGSEAGVAVALEPWGENTMAPWAGDWTIKVAGDLSTLTLVAAGEKPEVAVYLRGDMNGWGTPAEWKMTNLGDDNVFKFVAQGATVITAGTAFKFADAAWGSINIGLEFEEDVIVPDAEMPLWNNGSSKNIILEEEYEGNVWLQVEPAMLYLGEENPFAGGSAVEGVEVESNAAAVYYNLQGVRVAQPENGLYIVVKDGKAVKTLVK